MRRKLTKIATVLSLGMCLVSVILWVRCLFVFDLISFDAGGRSFQIWTPDRTLFLQWTSRPYRTPKWETEGAFHMISFLQTLQPQYRVAEGVSGKPHTYSWLGFYLTPAYYQPPYYNIAGCWFTDLGVPFYALFAMTLALPALQLRAAMRRGARVRRGLCITCGYDVRATPERCPECGQHPTAAAAA
jgi:hypothetical protein